MGRTTYEWILGHEFRDKDPSEWKWPYEQPVLGLHAPRADRRAGCPVEFTSGDVRAVHERMVEAAGGRNVWLVGGGDLVGQFADAGLLDEVHVSIAPVTLGAGKPLLPRRLELVLEETGRNGDFVAVRYSVRRPDDADA